MPSPVSDEVSTSSGKAAGWVARRLRTCPRMRSRSFSLTLSAFVRTTWKVTADGVEKGHDLLVDVLDAVARVDQDEGAAQVRAT
jgi:hypothetical protein